MTELKGQALCVNLSASQTRRRLKGFGHGVRKIQSAGKNRAVIIHDLHGGLFGLSGHELNVIHYCGIALVKLCVILFFFFP